MRLKPRILRVEETEIGKLLASSAEARIRHERIVSEFREAAREELEAIERSRRLTAEDFHGPILY
ncbi:MAG: hypothetical protein AAB364_00425 [Patescibacteria group bacterium]